MDAQSSERTTGNGQTGDGLCRRAFGEYLGDSLERDVSGVGRVVFRGRCEIIYLARRLRREIFDSAGLLSLRSQSYWYRAFIGPQCGPIVYFKIHPHFCFCAAFGIILNRKQAIERLCFYPFAQIRRSVPGHG